MKFLELDPMVGKFQWLVLVEEALAGKQRSEVDSLAMLNASL